MAGLLPGRGFESCPESVIFFWEQDQLATYGILITCSALLAVHGGTGGEICRDVLVTSADVKLQP